MVTGIIYSGNFYVGNILEYRMNNLRPKTHPRFASAPSSFLCLPGHGSTRLLMTVKFV